MSEAAHGHPRVKKPMYVASFLLEEAESAGELAGRFPGTKLGSALRPVAVRGPDGQTLDDLDIERDKFPPIFAADVPADVTELMAVTQRPIIGEPWRRRRPGGPFRPGPSSRRSRTR